MEPTLLDGDVVMVDRSNDLLMLRRSLKFLQKGSLKQANTTRFKALISLGKFPALWGGFELVFENERVCP